ncbi:MAG: serine hydrolase [Oscillospiraceae bacterium]|nr:serine hydrolase [Oscillospiraceae bacterium]
MQHMIEKIINRSLESKNLVGANCIVLKDGEELFGGAFGFSDKEKGIPMSRDSIFRLFSLTKPVTSAAAMILIDRGLLSPDDAVSDFFPEYSELSYMDENGDIKPCNTVMRVSHLLTMTSGLPYANNYNVSVKAAAKIFDALEDGQRTGIGITTDEFCRRAAKIPLSFVPGKHWDYGISADILGGIIEKASGMKLSEFMEENIFRPLGMKDTGFYVPKDKLSRFTVLYEWSDSGLVRCDKAFLGLTDYTAPPMFESGGAGLVSTIGDYAKFACALANGGNLGETRLFGQETFNYMVAPKLGEFQQNDMWERLAGYNYSCLMRVMTDVSSSQTGTVNGEFGWDGWTGTYFCADPNNKVVCLFFTQICGAGTTYEAVEIGKTVYRGLGL